ncbi:MAG TPA: DUF2249 domain-containing protein [Elusimicrobiota bacterium]|nr:DUF2249 domain-containing protein [Elusimicrobiota bacterium]
MKTEVLMDVRAMIPRERHPKIFAAWDALPVGGAIKLVNDHNPKPLYYQFQAEHAGEFRWTIVESGPDRWAVLIERVAQASAPAAAPGEPRPDWAVESPGALLDVREDLRAGKEPLGRILGEAAKVAEGGVLVVRATFDPKPLYHVLGAQGFKAWAERLSDEDWKIYFRKRRRASCGAHHGHEEDDGQDDGTVAMQGPGRVVRLDVSDLEPPEPMIRILQEIQSLKGEDVLEVSHHREPVPLYAELEAAGFSHETAQLGENSFCIRIWRKHG